MKPHIIFTIIATLTPVIVLLSGMAMVPVLLILALTIIASLPRDILTNPQQLFPNYKRFLLLIMALFALPIVTSYGSITPGKSFNTALRVFILCIIGMVALIYAPNLKRPSGKVIAAYALAIIIASVIILQELFLNNGLIRSFYLIKNMDYGRFIDKDVNRGLCALTVFIWPLVLALYNRQKYYAAWLMLAFMAVPIMLMHSLSAKVGLAASVVGFTALIYYPIAMGRIIMVGLPLFLLSFPLLFIVLETTFFVEPFVLKHLPDSALHRLHIWHVLIEEVGQRPLLGWGVDTTRALPLSAEQFAAINLTSPPLHPHSPSLQLLLEEGLIGFFISVGAIFLLLREWTRMAVTSSYTRPIIGAMIVAYFFTGVSSFGVWQYWWIATLWIAGIFLQWVRVDTQRTAAH